MVCKIIENTVPVSLGFPLNPKSWSSVLEQLAGRPVEEYRLKVSSDSWETSGLIRNPINPLQIV